MAERTDFEVGDEPVQVERRARAGVVVSVRLSAEEADELQRLAEARDTTVSRIAREAIVGYLRTGAVARPAGPPWTGTTTGFANLELITSGSGPVVRTRAEAPELVRS